MEIVKKNLLSIICGVVALAAVAVAFVVLPGNAEQLKTNLTARQQAHDTLKGLLTKERQLPSVDPDNPQQARLAAFPNEKISALGEELTKKVKQESEELRDAAAKMNEHKPLVPGCLPTPNNPTAISFSKAYQQALPLPTQIGAKARFAQELGAGMPPTPDEIRIRGEKEAKDIREKQLVIDSKGQAINQAVVDGQIAQLAVELPKKMLEESSKNSRIYVNPDTFEIYARISAAVGAPDPIDIYFAQLGYWIQQDVVAAINEINGKSKSIADSPVKYLISIRTKPLQGGPAFITAADGQAGGDPDGTIRKDTLVSPTGRVSNGLYDVFHFTVVVEVEAAKVPQFLRGLSTNRFITPLWCDIKSVDNATALAQGHVYGEKPMVNLTVDCEVLYLRKWNAPLMPKLIKDRLGITDPNAAAGATPAAATEAPTAAPTGAP